MTVAVLSENTHAVAQDFPSLNMNPNEMLIFIVQYQLLHTVPYVAVSFRILLALKVEDEVSQSSNFF